MKYVGYFYRKYEAIRQLPEYQKFFEWSEEEVAERTRNHRKRAREDSFDADAPPSKRRRTNQ